MFSDDFRSDAPPDSLDVSIAALEVEALAFQLKPNKKRREQALDNALRRVFCEKGIRRSAADNSSRNSLKQSAADNHDRNFVRKSLKFDLPDDFRINMDDV